MLHPPFLKGAPSRRSISPVRFTLAQEELRLYSCRRRDMEYHFDISTAEGFTTANVPVTTASASISTVSPSRVSTAEDISGAETLVYIRRPEAKKSRKTSLGTKLVKSLTCFKEEKEENKEEG
ncbi:hypothetical protein Tco_0798852 [Tanacetum coccineum]